MMTEDGSHGSRALPRPRALVLSIAALVVAADVATKYVASTVWATDPVSVLDGWVRLTESRNPGAAFGVGTSATPLFAVIAAIVVVGLIVFAGRCKTRWLALALGLLLGGAAGNLADRLFRAPGFLRGHVVDWIDIGAWPNFNLADAALVTACALLFLNQWRSTNTGSARTREGPDVQSTVSN